MREPGLLFSSSELATRLRQPRSNYPTPFSQVYVCDFELDFVTRDAADVLLQPIRELKEKNADLQAELDSVVCQLEKTQVSEKEAALRAEETRRALECE